MRVRTSCPAHNCGGRCLLVAIVEDGRIVRLEADDRTSDAPSCPRLVACVRGAGLPPAAVPPGPPDRTPETGRQAGRRAFRALLLGRGPRPRGKPDSPRARRARQRRPLRALWHGGVQQHERVASGAAALQPLRRMPRHRELLQLGLHQRRHADRLRHAGHRQRAPGLDQREDDSHVGLEPRGDDRRDQHRVLRAAGARPRRPRDLHRSPHDSQRHRTRRRVDLDPTRHRRRHDVGHRPRVDRGRPLRPGLRALALPRLR